MTAYPEAPLGQICQINPRAGKRASLGDQLVSFVPMSAVDEHRGVISRVQERRLAEVSSGYTSFQDGDVLFAKITPCMENGKAALAMNLANGMGRGSTEFYVLRPGDQVLGEYVYHFVRQKRFRNAAKRAFTGTAGQQRVPRSFMDRAAIPLPPLEEQRRIVDILDRVAKIERLRSRSQEFWREFVPALFVQMFGDPVENTMGWKIVELGEVGALDRGRSRHRPRNAPELYGGPYPFVQTGDVAKADGIIRRASQSYSEAGLRQSKMWPEGTLCITIAANIGKTAILAFDACFPDSVVGFVPSDLVTVEYVQSALDLMQTRIEDGAPMAAQRNINLRVLRGLRVPLPPFALQDRFAELIGAALVTSSKGSARSESAAMLNASLMSRLLGGFA